MNNLYSKVACRMGPAYLPMLHRNGMAVHRTPYGGNLPRVAGILSAPLGTGLPAIRGRDTLDTNLPIL
jgi:hypothetical protein